MTLCERNLAQHRNPSLRTQHRGVLQSYDSTNLPSNPQKKSAPIRLCHLECSRETPHPWPIIASI